MSVTQWRRVARMAAHSAMRGRKLIDGPVAVEVTFYLSRPAAQAKAKYPATGLDLDKLCRALGDALERVVVTNDARICAWSAVKLYADEAHNKVPQTVVTVREMDG